MNVEVELKKDVGHLLVWIGDGTRKCKLGSFALSAIFPADDELTHF